MSLYLDSSVILRLVFGEPGRLTEWVALTQGFASALAHVECLRTIDRFRLQGRLSEADANAAIAEVHAILAALSILPLSDDVLHAAAQALPTPVGTLDSLHLASALLLRNTNTTIGFATHDRELAVEARAMGLAVYGA